MNISNKSVKHFKRVFHKEKNDWCEIKSLFKFGYYSIAVSHVLLDLGIEESSLTI